MIHFRLIHLPVLVFLCLVLISCGVNGSRSVSHDLSILSYNTHIGKGMDGVLNLERISSVINNSGADLAGLQELDRFTKRCNEDQVAILASLTGMHAAFQKNLDYQGGEYGVAILSRWPILEERNLHFPEIPEREPRGALAVKVAPPHFPESVWLVTTHLGTDETGAEQLSQARLLLEWIRDFSPGIVILCGDFNVTPESETVTLLARHFKDSGSSLPITESLTFNSVNPDRRIDYIFIPADQPLLIKEARVIRTEASDHLPFFVRLCLHPDWR